MNWNVIQITFNLSSLEITEFWWSLFFIWYFLNTNCPLLYYCSLNSLCCGLAHSFFQAQLLKPASQKFGWYYCFVYLNHFYDCFISLTFCFQNWRTLSVSFFSVFLNCSCLFVLHITSCSTSILANSLYSAASNQLLLTTHCKMSLQIADLCTGLIQGIIGSLILVPSTDHFTENKF